MNLPDNPVSPSQSRRHFLVGSAATLGAAALLGKIAAAQNQVAAITTPESSKLPADAKKLRIGVIGLGGAGGCAMGFNHCRALIALDRKGREKVEVAAIADLNALFLESAKQEIDKAQGGSVKTYRTHTALLADKTLDGVIIAVPEHWHAGVAIEAIKAGLDVYLEKPMTLNLADALALHAACQAHPNVIVQVGTQQTRLPKYHAAKKLIADGAIGVPTFSQTSYCRNSSKENPPGEWHYKVDPAWKPGENLDWETWCKPFGSTLPWDPKLYYQWRRYRRASTGIIGDLLVHVMTPMLMAIDQGWPVRVAATGAHLVDKAMENHDNINIVAQFETGHQLFVCGSTCNNSGVETMIRGHKGNIFLGGRNCEIRPEAPWSDDVEPLKVECPDIGDDQDAHRVGFLQSIRTREKPDSSVDLGLKIMVIVDLATRSMWEGGAFAFDPKSMRVMKA
jgi:predicted dehydrogenase